MEFMFLVGAIAAVILIGGWRKSTVIASAPDSDLIRELKRRAYERKMKKEAASEVEAMITMNDAL